MLHFLDLNFLTINWVCFDLFLTCMSMQDLDEYKNLLKPRLKTIVQNEDREWFIVFVLKSVADSTNKVIKRVYSKLEGDFSSKRRER